jgi:hypothetical protein
MNFHPMKSEQLHFSRRRHYTPIDIEMEDEIVERVKLKHHKHRGVTLQSHGR